MSAQDVFNHEAKNNPQGYYAEKVNDNVLYTCFFHKGNVRQACYFDFLVQTVTILVTSSTQDRVLTFLECDSDTLERHRQKLTELGGNPLPLRRTLDKPGTSRTSGL